jgi:peroxiredoxin
MKTKALKKLSLFFLTLASLLLVTRIVHADLAPDFALTDVDGNGFMLSSFRGKVVVLDFFATYCSQCMDEMGGFKAVQSQFGGNVVIISISMYSKDTDDVLKQFRANYGISWIVARDTAGVWQAYGGMGIPAVYTIDQQGYIRYQHSGYTDASVFIGEIDGLISHFLLGDINGDGKVDILDVSLVAKAFGSRLGDDKWNEAADLNDDGAINILDISTVAKDFGKKDSHANLLLNPSVETDENGNSLPDHWERGSDNDVVAIHTWLDVGYTGSHSLRVSVAYNASAAGGNAAGWYQSLGYDYSPLNVGARYLFRLRYQSSVKCTIYAGFWDNSGKWIGGQFLECAKATGWTSSQWLEFTVPTGSHTEAVGFLVRNSDAAQESNAYAIADDFELILG